MTKSPEEMAATMIANLPEKTGKPLEDWLDLVRPMGLHRHGEIVNMLKTEHDVTHGYANLIATKSLEELDGEKTDEELVHAQYAGPKAGLYPIYETLVGVAERMGDDVTVSPKKTYVSLRRAKQFAIIQPSTRDRVDLGLNLKEAETTDRLEPSGSFNAMVSHKVALEDSIEVDSEVKDWLQQAYDEAG